MMAKTCPIGAVVIVRAPCGDPELAIRHGSNVRQNAQFQFSVFAETKTPGFAHADTVQRDAFAVPSPETVGHAVAVEDSTVHLAGDGVPGERVQLLPQKVGGLLVTGVVAAGYHFPFSGDQRILTLLEQAVHLIVAQQFCVLAQVAAQADHDGVGVGQQFPGEPGKVEAAIGKGGKVRA